MVLSNIHQTNKEEKECENFFKSSIHFYLFQALYSRLFQLGGTWWTERENAAIKYIHFIISEIRSKLLICFELYLC